MLSFDEVEVNLLYSRDLRNARAFSHKRRSFLYLVFTILKDGRRLESLSTSSYEARQTIFQTMILGVLSVV